jgi:hypothetical protein
VCSEAAQTAGAGFIVSGDRHLLDLGRWGEVAIFGPAELLAALVPEESTVVAQVATYRSRAAAMTASRK